MDWGLASQLLNITLGVIGILAGIKLNKWRKWWANLSKRSREVNNCVEIIGAVIDESGRILEDDKVTPEEAERESQKIKTYWISCKPILKQ